MDTGKYNILGIFIDAVDYQSAVERIVHAATQRKSYAVSALAVHGLMTGVLDSEHRYRLNRFDMIAPDGQPVRWALNRLHGLQLKDRVYGPDLMLKTCQRAAEEQLPVFLFGGTEDLLARLQEKLLARFPKLRIAGVRASQFRKLDSHESDEVVKEIRDSGAAMTFVGLGCPRQEVWTYEFRERLSMPVLAVGAAFNFHAGQLVQAPVLMQRNGLEWLFRLVQEPGRLWRRYLLLNPLYVLLVSLQWSRLMRFDPQDATPPRGELLYG